MRFIYLFLVFLIIIVCPGIALAISSSENYQEGGGRFDYELGNQAESSNYNLYDPVYNDGSGTYSVTTPSPSASPTQSQRPTTAPTDLGGITTQNNISGISGVLDNILDSFKENSIVEAITSNSSLRATKTPLAVGTAVLTGLIAVIPFAANFALSLSFGNIISSIFPFVGKRKKEKQWGIIYDSQTNEPVASAIVRLISKETNKVEQTQVTDNDGRFGFMVTPGTYFLQVNKNNYIFPSVTNRNDYHGGLLTISQRSSINVNIALDPQMDKLTQKINFIWSLKKILEYMYYPLLFFGSILALSFYLKLPHTENLLALWLYLVIFVYELDKNHRSRPFGIVFDKNNKNPIELAIIRIFNAQLGKLITTKVTDAKGKFVFLVQKGQYYLTVIKSGYKPYQGKQLEITSNILVNSDIPLEREKTAET